MPIEPEDKKFVEQNIELIGGIQERLRERKLFAADFNVITAILLVTVISRFEEKISDLNSNISDLCGNVNSVGDELPHIRNSINDLGSDIRAIKTCKS